MSHHFPFCTDVRSRTQDDQETCLIGQIQKMLQISVPREVLDPLYGFMEVPGHISVCRQSKCHSKVRTCLVTQCVFQNVM